MSMPLPQIHVMSFLAFAVACDTRADEHYPGQSLLHLEGQVRFEEEPEDASELVPALAFVTDAGLEIVEVEVQGSFPSNFRIEVYSPPPIEARMDSSEDLDLPPGVQLAVAYIAAVPRNHLKELRYAHSFYAGLPISELQACATATPACQRVERWCIDTTQRECRLLGFPCAENDRCEPTVSEGDPAIIDRPSDALAGLSEKFVIVWTRAGLPASSVFSRALGIEQDLRPGYNLVELGELKPDDEEGASDTDCLTCIDGACRSCDGSADTTDPDACTDPVCEDPILAEALERYNAAHGTDYAGLREVEAELYPPSADDQSALVAFEKEFYFIVDQISIEQGIDISELEGTTVRESTRVIEDWETPLIITVSPDVDPII